MDINLSQAKFPTKGFILDNIAQVLGIVLPRKDIQRLIREEKISPDKINELINEILDKALLTFFTHDQKNLSDKVKTVLHSFFQFYTEFTLAYETYKVSQKQLNYLLLKDLFIPLAADMCAIIFKEDILILTTIKPTTAKLPIPKIFEWMKQHVPYQSEFQKTLEKKYFDENPLIYEESKVRKNLYKWKNGEITPTVKSINLLVQYIKPDINNTDDQKNFKNLFLFARMMQKLYKLLRENYEQEHIDLLVEHFYMLLKFYFHYLTFPSKVYLEKFIYDNYFDHINPKILNRNIYWDDYFSFMINVLYTKIDKKIFLRKE